MRVLLIGLVAAVVLIAGVLPARADYFVWQDPETGLTMSYPDTWALTSNQDPDDIVTIKPPAGRGQAMCRIRVRDDGRYAIYPSRYDWAIQKIDFSLNFWDQYLREYNHAALYNLQDGAGIGRGWASYAVAGYKSAIPGPMMDRQALMFASLYNEKVYIVECSAHKDVFNDWKGMFLSFAKSVDFRKADHEMVSGHYRNFMADPRILLYGPNREYLTAQ